MHQPLVRYRVHFPVVSSTAAATYTHTHARSLAHTVLTRARANELTRAADYADAPLEAALVEKITMHPRKVKGWKKFKEDIATGTHVTVLAWW